MATMERRVRLAAGKAAGGVVGRSEMRARRTTLRQPGATDADPHRVVTRPRAAGVHREAPLTRPTPVQVAGASRLARLAPLTGRRVHAARAVGRREMEVATVRSRALATAAGVDPLTARRAVLGPRRHHVEAPSVGEDPPASSPDPRPAGAPELAMTVRSVVVRSGDRRVVPRALVSATNGYAVKVSPPWRDAPMAP
jgi:hypothetical protein